MAGTVASSARGCAATASRHPGGIRGICRTEEERDPFMSAPIISDGKLRVVVEALESATGARKCHQCGCFQDTVRALKELSLIHI